MTEDTRTVLSEITRVQKALQVDYLSLDRMVGFVRLSLAPRESCKLLMSIICVYQTPWCFSCGIQPQRLAVCHPCLPRPPTTTRSARVRKTSQSDGQRGEPSSPREPRGRVERSISGADADGSTAMRSVMRTSLSCELCCQLPLGHLRRRHIKRSGGCTTCDRPEAS